MEKTENGCIFRNNAQEQKAAKKYCDQKQIRMENLYSKIQKQFENSSQPKGTLTSELSPHKRMIINVKNIVLNVLLIPSFPFGFCFYCLSFVLAAFL